MNPNTILSKPSRILVTGATGFIGRHVARALANCGHKIVALVRERPLSSVSQIGYEKVFVGDICDSNIQRDALRNVDAVCHLAAHIPTHYDDPKEAERCYQVNALATLRLATRAIDLGIKQFVYYSAGNMYSPLDRPCTENDPVYPVRTATYYMASKLAGELYLSHVVNHTETAATILRIGSPYGPGGPEQQVVATFMRRASRGEELHVRHGDSATYNLVYVEDVAWCTAHAIETRSSGIYNIAGTPSSLKALAEAVRHVYQHREVTICVEPEQRDDFAGFPAMDIDKAQKAWGFEPTSLLDGLQAYRSFLTDDDPKNNK